MLNGERQKMNSFLKDAGSDMEALRDVYATARNKYKPASISVLLIAEAPPNALDRYFYFEDVKKQDSLFLEIMGVLFPERKKRYLASGRDTMLKMELLEQFREEGFWLINLSEITLGISDDTAEACVPSLLKRLQKYIDPKTPVIFIKANVYDLLYPVLLTHGYNVIKERIPFPGSGQQAVFRTRFKKALRSL